MARSAIGKLPLTGLPSKAANLVLAIASSAAVWAFVLGTGATLFARMIYLWMYPEAQAHIFAVEVDGEVQTGWGLSYFGHNGAILMAIEAVTILFALGLSLSAGPIVRRIALLVLLAWAALWFGNAAWLTWLSRDVTMAQYAAVLGLLTFCTLCRTGHLWTERH